LGNYFSNSKVDTSIHETEQHDGQMRVGVVRKIQDPRGVTWAIYMCVLVQKFQIKHPNPKGLRTKGSKKPKGMAWPV